MDLLSYFRVLRRRWLLILVFALVGGALGVASTLFKQDAAKTRTYYKAIDTLVLNSSAGGEAVGAPSITNLDQMALLATTGDVPDAVAARLGGSESGQQLAERVVTNTSQVTNTMRITAAAATADEATNLADTFSSELLASLNAKELARYNAQRDQLSKQLSDFKSQADGFLAQTQQQPKPPDVDTILKQYDATQNQYYATYGQLQQLLSAGPPQTPLSLLTKAQAIPISQAEYNSRLSLGALGQNNLRDDGGSSGTGVITATSSSSLDSRAARGVLGALLGLLAGVGFALLMEHLDRRIRNRADAEAAYQQPVLTEVPHYPSKLRADEVIARSQPISAIAEAYRSVRTSVLFQLTGSDGFVHAHDSQNGNGIDSESQSPLVIMVTSAVPGEGKSATTANLAVVFAEGGSKVLVVNCDFRRPTIHKNFALEDLPRHAQTTSIRGVTVVTNVLADPDANPAQYLSAQRQVVAAAREHFDVVLLDTAPVLVANDPLALVPSADLVLLVARAESTRIDDARSTAESLIRMDAPLGGVILVSNQSTPSRTYYYGVPPARGGSEAAATPAVEDVVFANGDGAGTTDARVEAAGQSTEQVT